nr:phospholipase-like protein [Tanacetum cinerariifolium]
MSSTIELSKPYDCKVTIRSRPSTISFIKERLSKSNERLKLFKDTVFGKYLDIDVEDNDNHLLNYVLHHQSPQLNVYFQKKAKNLENKASLGKAAQGKAAKGKVAKGKDANVKLHKVSSNDLRDALFVLYLTSAHLRSTANTNDANNQRGNGLGQKPTCYECGAQGHFKRECPKLKNNNHHGNQGRRNNAPAR